MHKLRRFGFNAIKESFDRLPTAVCFFDRSGGIVLCNRQMYRLSQYLLNSDMQYLEELQKALASPPKGIMPIASTENTYRFPDGLVWKFEKAAVTDRYGETNSLAKMTKTNKQQEKRRGITPRLTLNMRLAEKFPMETAVNKTRFCVMSLTALIFCYMTNALKSAQSPEALSKF